MAFILIMLLLSYSCKSLPGSRFYSSDEDGDAASVYARAVAQATDEAAMLKPPAISQDQELAIKLKHDPGSINMFQKLRKQHKMLLFIKDIGIHEDDKRVKPDSENEVYKEITPVLSSPIEYEFNANLLVSCQKFINEPGFNELNKDFFQEIPQEENLSHLNCGSIKFNPIDNRRVNRDKGDVAEVRLYLDSRYRPYGADVVKYVDKSSKEQVSFFLDHTLSVSSRFDFVPYDLPNLYMLSRQVVLGKAMPKAQFTNTVPIPNDPYLRKTIQKRGINLCGGKQVLILEYRENFGTGVQKVSWCEGDAWPTVIENKRFIAILSQKPQ